MRELKLLQIGILMCIYTPNVSANLMEKTIPWKEDKWEEGRRSIPTLIPAIASINETLLIIQCTTECSDITVCITGEDGFFYEEIFFSYESHLITIDLANAPKGSYTLHLTNQWNDHLTGSFEIS